MGIFGRIFKRREEEGETETPETETGEEITEENGEIGTGGGREDGGGASDEPIV